MDPLTHSLTGVLLSRAGLNRVTPHATLLLVLAANAPDADLITWVGGSVTYLRWHRHFTHCLAMIPVMALLPLVIVRWILRRRLPLARAWLACCVGVLSHPLLDWTNAYGIRLALPFNDHWYRLDITHVIDIWITAFLLLAVLGPMLSRLVSQEIGARVSAGRGWARFGLSFLLLYEPARAVLHARAVATLESRIYRGASPVRVAAVPTAFSPLHWRGVVETPDFYALAKVNLADEFDPRGAGVYPKRAAPEIDRVRDVPAVRTFLRFASYPVWWWETGPKGLHVNVTDLRFGTPDEPAFVATVALDRTGRVLDSGFYFD